MPTRAIRVWNEATSTWENVGVEGPAIGLDEATASATYLRQDTASATYLPISASSTLVSRGFSKLFLLGGM
jgi:hypothetical protein